MNDKDEDNRDGEAPDPGSTATGPGTSIGTTEADVTDGREQKLPKVD